MICLLKDTEMFLLSDIAISPPPPGPSTMRLIPSQILTSNLPPPLPMRLCTFRAVTSSIKATPACEASLLRNVPCDYIIA